MRNNELLKQFGERVRELRLRRGLTQEDLAFKSGLHRTYIGMIERAEKNVTILNLQKLANALDVSLPTLLTLIKAKNDSEQS